MSFARPRGLHHRDWRPCVGGGIVAPPVAEEELLLIVKASPHEHPRARPDSGVNAAGSRSTGHSHRGPGIRNGVITSTGRNGVRIVGAVEDRAAPDKHLGTGPDRRVIDPVSYTHLRAHDS